MTHEHIAHHQELEKPESFKLIELFVDQLAKPLSEAGTTFSKQLIRDNILSLRRVIAQGKHEVVFDPASGRDAVRLLLAYDPAKLIVVDRYLPLLQETQQMLTQLLDTAGIYYQAQEGADEVVVSFTLDKIPRQVVFKNVDSRDIELPQLDVWHSYLPTGAEEETTRQREARRSGEEHTFIMGDESPTVHEGFTSGLKWNIYSAVKNDGFMAINESPLLGELHLPKLVGDLLGLQEKDINSRHPYTVLTSFHPTTIDPEYHGTIIHKTKDLSFELFQQALEVIDTIHNKIFMLNSLEAMQLYYFASDEGVTHPIDILTDLQTELQNELAQLLPALEPDPLKATEVVADCRRFLKLEIQKYQTKLKTFFELLDSSEEMSSEEKKQLFKITSPFGSPRSEAFPFAPELLKADRSTIAIFREVAEHSF